MSTQDDLQQSFDLLDATLDVYGGDIGRWPESRRVRLASFIAGNQDAQHRVAAAGALDTVLGFAPRLSEAQTAALANRIVEKAARQPRVVTESVGQPQPWRSRRSHHGLAGAALAASLVLGIVSGQSGTFSALGDILSGNGTALTSGSPQVAQIDDADTILDEDLL